MEKWVTGEPITASKMNQIGDSIDNANTIAIEALSTANSAQDENTRLKNALTQVTTLTGNPIVITNALAMTPNNITIEITPAQDGVPTPSAPIDINSYSMIALTRTDGTGGNSATRFIDLDFLASGSVYGGEIVLNEDGTNTLSITWVKKTLAQLNADVRPFQYNTTYSHGVFRTSFTGLKYGNSTIGFCNSYGFYRSEQLKTLGNTMPDKQFGFQNTTSWVVFRDDDYQVANYASEDDMIAAWLADHADTYIVYELKTPIEIPINIMKLSLLDGENILTNDAGLSMTLAYREARSYTDSTLTKVNTAADAKATGDKIMELENKVIKKTDFSNYIGSMSGKIENSVITRPDSTTSPQQYIGFAPFQNVTQLIINKAKSNIFTIGFSTTPPKSNTSLSNVTYHSEATEVSVDTPDKTGYVVIQYYNSTTESPESLTQQEVLDSIKVIGINTPTDTTLTQQYVAADAKRVGDLGKLLVQKGVITQSEWNNIIA